MVRKYSIVGRSEVQEPQEAAFSEGMQAPPEIMEDHVPHLLIQLQDDLARARQREAFWISVASHLVALFLLLFAPKFLPQGSGVVVITPADLLRDRELTYLAMPHDRQPPAPAPPKTNVISDKDRVASSRTPTLDPRELQRILDASRPGAPGQPAAPAAPSQNLAQAGPQGQAGPQHAQAPANDMARLQLPPQPAAGAFSMPSATSQLEMAQRGAAQSRGGGVGGEFGMLPRSQAKVGNGTEVLSDTMGVDFSNYLERLRWVVRQHWMVVMPESAMRPPYAKGHVAVQFKITRDGRVEELYQAMTSGDFALDRAALSAIQLSNPFERLPREFGGPFIILRCHFFYNPDINDLQ